MLVLRRKVGEAIVVDHDIRIVVLAVDRRGIRLGIEAPAHRSVLREELVIEIARENQRAAAGGVPGLLAGQLTPITLAPVPLSTPGADPVP